MERSIWTGCKASCDVMTVNDAPKQLRLLVYQQHASSID